jgi:HEAT repeats
MSDPTHTEPDFNSVPLEAVVEMAVKAWIENSDEYWSLDAPRWLLHRPAQTLIQVCDGLLNSAELKRASLATYLLGQANRKHPELRSECCDRLRAILLVATEPELMSGAIAGLGVWRDEREFARFVELKAYSDPDVRMSVVHALTSLDTEESIRQLLSLTGDFDDEIRNWAVFGAGSMSERDFPELRQALAMALDDKYEIVRLEAAAGLASRRDRRAIEAVKALLESMEPGTTWHKLWEIAEVLAAPELVPVLQVQFDRDNPNDPELMLAAALEACKDGGHNRSV